MKEIAGTLASTLLMALFFGLLKRFSDKMPPILIPGGKVYKYHRGFLWVFYGFIIAAIAGFLALAFLTEAPLFIRYGLLALFLVMVTFLRNDRLRMLTVYHNGDLVYSKGSREIRFKWDDITEVKYSEWFGALDIYLASGTKVQFTTGWRGKNDFAEELERNLTGEVYRKIAHKLKNSGWNS